MYEFVAHTRYGFNVTPGLRRMCVRSPSLLNYFFAAVLRAVLERFSDGADRFPCFVRL